MKLDELKISTKEINILSKREINTVESLLVSKPKRYLFFNKLFELKLEDELKYNIANKIPVAVLGLCKKVDKTYNTNTKRSLIKIRIYDERTDSILFVNYLGQYNKYQEILPCINKKVIAGGVLQYSDEYKCFSMMNPVVLSPEIEKYSCIIPEYRKYKGISDENYERIIEKSLSIKGDLDFVPENLLKRRKLSSFKATVKMLHQPKDISDIKKAQQRLLYNDMLYFTTKLEIQNLANNKETVYKINKTDKTDLFIKNLPYKLTDDQKKCVTTILNKMKRRETVSSLIQGDVSCGKTIVAFIIMMAMAENGYQSVLMAPTIVLAKQHFKELQQYAKEYGYKTIFLSNELKSKDKKDVLNKIKEGYYSFIIGTHTCISKNIEYSNLGLAITDEEHKFGVVQRETLLNKTANGMHSIMMSATPIPRSLACTLYGNSIEVCTIKQMPNGRKPVQTAICLKDKTSCDFMLKEIKKGHQCYVVCPLIEKAEKESKMNNISSIEVLQQEYLKYFKPFGIKIGVITGKTKKEEQTQIINDFQTNKLQILMATTVIEVGINVPNATCITITGAERFGLATLHQLRGRVGRGQAQSYCILQQTPGTKKSDNLEILRNETDGFKIAQADLQNRGAGNILGTEQSGQNKYLQLMLSYPNLYREVKKDAIQICKNNTGKDFLTIYEELFL